MAGAGTRPSRGVHHRGHGLGCPRSTDTPDNAASIYGRADQTTDTFWSEDWAVYGFTDFFTDPAGEEVVRTITIGPGLGEWDTRIATQPYLLLETYQMRITQVRYYEGTEAPEPENIITGTGALSSEGTLLANGEFVIVFTVAMAILDDEIDQAPSVLTVVIMEGWPDQQIEFEVDGVTVFTTQLDSEGELPATSVPIPDTVMAGVHVLTVVPLDFPESTIGTSAPFLVERDPDLIPYIAPQDADPIEIPEALLSTGVRRWVLQDLMPGGLGSWVMPANPDSATPFPAGRTLSEERTISPTGKFHIRDAMGEPTNWSCTGTYFDRVTQDKLLAYARLNRRWYLIDHRNRAWTVAGLGLDLIPRKRIRDIAGVDNDEAGQYTLRCLVLGNEWKEPQ